MNDTRTDTERFEDYQAELTAKRRDALWRQLAPKLTLAQRERLQRKVREVYGTPRARWLSFLADTGGIGLVLILLGLLALAAMAIL